MDSYNHIENQRRGKIKQYKEVSMYDSNGEHIADFISESEASRFIGAISSSVFLSIKTGTKAKGYYFTYKNKPLAISDNRKKVYQYDLNMNYIASYDGVREAGRAINKDYTSIIKCCKGRQRTAHGFIWSYVKYDNAGIDNKAE